MNLTCCHFWRSRAKRNIHGKRRPFSNLGWSQKRTFDPFLVPPPMFFSDGQEVQGLNESSSRYCVKPPPGPEAARMRDPRNSGQTIKCRPCTSFWWNIAGLTVGSSCKVSRTVMYIHSVTTTSIRLPRRRPRRWRQRRP